MQALLSVYFAPFRLQDYRLYALRCTP